MHSSDNLGSRFSEIPQTCLLSIDVLFGLMLYVHGKQLRSCQDGQLTYPHVPGQASQQQVTST